MQNKVIIILIQSKSQNSLKIKLTDQTFLRFINDGNVIYCKSKKLIQKNIKLILNNSIQYLAQKRQKI